VGNTVREKFTQLVLLLGTLVALAVLAILLIDIAFDGVGGLSLNFLSNYTSRFPEMTGIRAGITGTLSLMLLTALMTFPLGVGLRCTSRSSRSATAGPVCWRRTSTTWPGCPRSSTAYWACPFSSSSWASAVR